MSYYPDSKNKQSFIEILNKYEFNSNSEDKNKKYNYQEPFQLFMRNYISLYTPYESILLYAYLGTGKTCTAISIAEGFKEYITNMGRKIVVLVKNQNIKKNFYNELLSSCTQSDYLTDVERELYFSTKKLNTYDLVNDKKELTNRINRTINKSYNFITYGKFVNQVLGLKEFEKDSFGNSTKISNRINNKTSLTNLNNTVIIVDEAHNITNTDVYIALKKILTKSYNYRLILLTATPISDNPKEIFEISNLLNINNPELQFPIRNELFKPDSDNNVLIQRMKSNNVNNNLLKGGVINITSYGKTQLINSLYGKISHIQANTDTNPKKIEMGTPITSNKGSIKVVFCNMSEYQYKLYIQGVKSDIKDSNTDITTIQNIQNTMGGIYKNSSDASTMTYPENKIGKDGYVNTFNNNQLKIEVKNNLKKYSSKLYTLFENVKVSKGNVFIFTNYVNNGGTKLLRELFLLFGYVDFKNSQNDANYKSFVIYDESSTPESREKYRRIFNHPANKTGKFIKIIIGSPMISEGITLKNVRQIHLLEPSWNMSRINQIIGRAVRNYSHHDLDESERNVEIYKYASVYTGENNNSVKFYIDKEKYILSEEKDRSNKIVERILKSISLDCSFFKSRNTKDSEYDYTAECDYTKCNYTCMVKSDNIEIDKSTYRLNIDFFDKYDIQFVTSKLRELFSKYFIWELNDINSYIKNYNSNISFDVIYHTISNIIDNKMLFTDIFNRDGFIINKGNYYIFNPVGVNVDDSLYSKMFDFSINVNKYNLDNFAKLHYNKDLFEDKGKQKDKESDSESGTSIIEEVLTKKQITYNNNIIDNNEVYGTFRLRGKNTEFGKKTGVFRIVDLRDIKGKNGETDDDRRKSISGMAGTSYKKSKLVDIATYLGITINGMNLSEYTKEQLVEMIERDLNKKKLVLL